MMNAVWMLDEFTTDIGATRIVPGSHKSGYAKTPTGVEIKNIQTAVGCGSSEPLITDLSPNG